MTDPLGMIRPLVRRLSAEPDPLLLYRALGAGPNTFLLESADRATGSGERSLIGARPALHLAADRRTTRITALSPNGQSALEWLETQLPTAVSTGGVLEAPHQPAAPGPIEETARFRQPSPLDLVRRIAFGPRLSTRPNPWCHLLAGVIGYDAIDYFEALPAGAPDPLEQPLVEFWVPDALVVIDHRLRTTAVVTTAWGGRGAQSRLHDAAGTLERLVALVAATPSARGQPTPVEPVALGVVAVDQDDETFAMTVRRLVDHLRAGDAYQIVPSRTFSLPCDDPLGAYAQLRRRNPSPYLFYLHGSERTLFGASPETCLRIDGPTRRATVVPIAGTAARGVDRQGRLDPEADTRNEAALRHDSKEHAEHVMLVDLARNDIARISVPGTRQVSRLLAVERYAHVMHLVSEVTGILRPEIDALEAFAATMNMGTLVGAPKVRATELLRAVEPTRRGCYGGGVGYLREDGTLETAIVIRSAVVKAGVARVRAGAGVVLDSDPLKEARETSLKARVVLEAIAASASDRAAATREPVAAHA